MQINRRTYDEDDDPRFGPRSPDLDAKRLAECEEDAARQAAQFEAMLAAEAHNKTLDLMPLADPPEWWDRRAIAQRMIS